jgi:hypothetical protein
MNDIRRLVARTSGLWRDRVVSCSIVIRRRKQQPNASAGKTLPDKQKTGDDNPKGLSSPVFSSEQR